MSRSSTYFIISKYEKLPSSISSARKELTSYEVATNLFIVAVFTLHHLLLLQLLQLLPLSRKTFFPTYTYIKMKLSILASLVASAAAFVAPQQKTSTPSTALNMAKFKPQLKYVPCIPVEDLPSPGSATSGVAGGLAICIAVDPKGSVYALGDKCPPVNQPLSFGKVSDDGTIQDPVLGTKFSLKTGDVVGQWCPSGIGRLIGGAFTPIGVPTYPVKKSGKFIEVQVDVNAKANFEANYWSGILDAQGKADGKYY